MSREMHFTYKMRDGKRGIGWLTRNETTDRFTSCLLDASKYNQHVEFIEWSDRINCMVRDGQYISSVNFFMTKEEFAKFLDRVVPAGVAK